MASASYVHLAFGAPATLAYEITRMATEEGISRAAMIVRILELYVQSVGRPSERTSTGVVGFRGAHGSAAIPNKLLQDTVG